MTYIQPKPVQKGDTIGIIAPCGAIENKDSVFRGIKKLEEMGFKVKISEHLFDKKNYLAGEDSVRKEELEFFFKDPKINCILCARGGFGAIRILDKIDYDIIRSNPKAFCGYSDVTAISIMILKRANLITYSSPMLCGDFGTETISDFTVEHFLDSISNNTKSIYITGDENKTAEGIIWGGNLTTLASLCGRDFLPKEKFVFFIEDINEPVYKIDRGLAQLTSIKEFRENISGIVAGDFSGTHSTEELSDVFTDYAQTLNIPLWEGLKWGHEKEKVTIPIGKICLIKGNKIFFN